MTAIAKSSRASVDATTGMIAPQISGLIAGAAIAACMPCYIDSATGKVFPADGSAAGTQTSRVAGWCPRAANAGEPVTLLGLGTVMKYSDALLVPGSLLFLSAAGALDTAATTGDTVGVAQAISASAIRVTRAI